MIARPQILAGIAAFCALIGLVLSGSAAFGRLGLSLGLASLASPFMPEGDWRAVAQYRGGDFSSASSSFGEGAAGAFNRGNAFAHAGLYAQALASYEDAQALAPGFVDAAVNHAIVAEVFAGTKFEAPLLPLEGVERPDNVLAAPPGEGGGRAQGTGSEANNPGSTFNMHDVMASGLRRVPRIFDDKYVEANERWLRTLEDQPGAYLKARIDAERKRRAALQEESE